MKLFILVGMLFGAVSASAIEVPASVDCLIYKGDMSQRDSNLGSPLPINFSHDHLANNRDWLPAGEYEGMKLSLDVSLPREEYGDKNIHVTLSDTSLDGRSVVTLTATEIAGDRTHLMYRKPESTKFVIVHCAVRR